MATKANHHFIPQFYLRSFANGVGGQARVFTFDNESKMSFTTLVRNVGSRRYFNKVEIEGVDPNALEDAFAKAEGEISPHFFEVIEARKFPTPKQFNSMMNLIAYLSVRNPRQRGNISDFHERVAKKVLDVALASESRWNSQVEGMKRSGIPLKDDITYEDIKEFHEKGEYDIVFDTTYLIGLEMKMIDPVLECLHKRKWCFVTGPEGRDFITSDDPVVLYWADNRRGEFYPPGHGLANTVVLFPICPEAILMGTFEDIPQSMEYSALQVTYANTAVAKYSDKQIYARNGQFRLNLVDREDVLGRDIAKYI